MKNKSKFVPISVAAEELGLSIDQVKREYICRDEADKDNPALLKAVNPHYRATGKVGWWYVHRDELDRFKKYLFG